MTFKQKIDELVSAGDIRYSDGKRWVVPAIFVPDTDMNNAYGGQWTYETCSYLPFIIDGLYNKLKDKNEL